jgi:hypothetical protein
VRAGGARAVAFNSAQLPVEHVNGRFSEENLAVWVHSMKWKTGQDMRASSLSSVA